MVDPGSYLLVIECKQSTEIADGALGSLSFAAGVFG